MDGIRIARTEDAKALTELAIKSEAYWGYDEHFMEIFRREYQVTEEFIRNNPTYVLEENEKILGFYGLILRPTETELEYLFIEPDRIGTGLGKILWEHMKKECELRGIKELILVTSPQAKAFYEKMGAVHIGDTHSLVIPNRIIPKLKYYLEKKTGIVVIDVQMAMFHSLDGGAVLNGEQVLERILSLLDKGRKAGVPIFFIQHTDPTDEEYAEGKDTWMLHPALSPRPSEPVIRKSTWDSFHKTLLEGELKKAGVEKLIFAGMQTEFCVDTTCRRAFSLGYESILIKDGHTTFDSPTLKAEQIIAHHNRIMDGRFVQLVEEWDIQF